MKKRNLMFLSMMFLILLISSSVLVSAQTNFLEDIGTTGKNAWYTVLDVGRLKFLGTNADNQVLGFVRILIGILAFILFYLGVSVIPGLTRPMGIGIAIILAVMVSVFLPGTVLTSIASTYAVLFAFIIMGTPIAAGLWLILGTPTPNRSIAVIKLVGVLFAMWLVSQIGHWAHLVTGVSV
ncbi:hypothetical protein HOC13_02070 [Candidatus Woesearchaeota archaeon]|jgi:hypothetical protein|nr:hypothetical protein [Candidatus Woesearchaeota archaeon]